MRIAMLSPVMNDSAGRMQTRWRRLERGDWIFEMRRAWTGEDWQAWQTLGGCPGEEMSQWFGDEVGVDVDDEVDPGA